MFLSRSRIRIAAAVVVLLFSESPFARAAQGPPPPATAEAAPAAAAQVVVTDQDARETRADLEGVLKRLPPTSGAYAPRSVAHAE